MKHIFTLAVCILFFSFTVSAQWMFDSTLNSIVKDELAVSEITPLQATTPDGKTFISWFESSGGSYVMKMQLLDVQGYKLWSTDGLLISDHPQSSAVYVYDLASDHEGNAILAFQDQRNLNLRPVAYKIDQAGNFFWGNDGIELHDSLASFELGPAICILPDNDVIIGWNSSDALSDKWVTYEKINANGSLPWISYKQIKLLSHKYSRPDFAARNDGTYLMSYINEVGIFPGVSSYIYVDRFDTTGHPAWPSAVEVSTYSTTFFDFPKISGDSANGIIIGFNGGDPGDPAINDAFVQRVASDGTLLWGTNGIEISSYSNHHRLLGDISFNSDSDHVAVAMKVLDNAQGQAGIYVQKIDADGNKLWGTDGYQILPLSATSYHEPFGIALADSGWIVVYTEGDVISQKLKAIKIDLNGNVVWGGVSLSTFTSNKFDATVGLFMNNQLVVVWNDQRIDDGVYAQNVSGQGTLGVVATSMNEPATDVADIFPSLTRNHLIIELYESSGSAEFQLIDLMGRIVLSKQLQAGMNEIDLSSISPAIYIYHLSVNNVVQNGKICKQ